MGIVAILACLLFITFRITGFPSTSDFSVLAAKGVLPDSVHERVLGWEAIWGDPYQPLDEVMPKHGYEGWTGGVAPRPPSALLLQTSLLLVPQSAFMPTMAFAAVVLLMWIGWTSQKISGLAEMRFLLGASILIPSLLVLSSLSYSPVLGLFAVALLLASWRYQDRPWAGLLLGVSAALRLWPGLVIVGFWISGRRKLARTAVLTFVALNLIGLLLPGVTLAGSLRSLLDGGNAWLNHNMNSSVALVLWPLGVPPLLSVMGVASAGIWLAARNRAHAVPITILAALLASPLSWPTYALATVPILALYARLESPAPVVALLAALSSWSLWPRPWLGHVHFAVLAVMLLLVARPRTIDLTGTDSRSLDRESAVERPGSASSATLHI